ncbi:MAG: Acetyl-CoA acetyltransferase [bacterium]|nr:Acetyl-CoA acetyltransferase [bacterium]
MPEVVIVAAKRTPIGRFLGGLAPLSATDLGAIAIRGALESIGLDPTEVNEVVMGNVISSGVGQAPARQAAIKAGIPPHRSAYTINMVCGSGLQAVNLAYQSIKAGMNQVVVAGGMESMSNTPYLLQGDKARTGYRLGNGQLLDSMVADGLTDAYLGIHMGETAERVADKYHVSREDMDRFAADSQAKAVAAIAAGHFRQEIVPVTVSSRKGDVTIDTDEGPRADSTFESLSALRPVFRREGGRVTAGNAPSTNDGAAAVVVMSDTRAQELGLTPLARIKDATVGGVEPEWVLMSPVVTVQRLIDERGWDLKDFDLVELNEAFAVQAVAVIRELGLDPAKVNVNGGAVALGHPIGCSGARILTTLLHALQQRRLKTGLATLCLGGGNGVALVIENLQAGQVPATSAASSASASG